MINKDLESIYLEYVNDESFIGIKNILNKYGIIGRCAEDKYKSLLYDKYGKDNLKAIYLKRLHAYTLKIVNERNEKKYNETLVKLQPISEIIYSEFLTNENICGLTTIFKRRKIGSKTANKVRKILYDKYGRDNIYKITRIRSSKTAHMKRSRKSYKHTKEWNDKIGKSNILSWINSDDTRREISRNNIKKYCFPKNQTDEVKLKRVKSRKWYKPSKETIEKMRLANIGRKFTSEHKNKLSIAKIGYVPWMKGRKHSAKTKKLLAEITKSHWKNGIHKRTFKSKGQLEVINILKSLGYNIQDEYLLDGRPFDIFVKEKNLLIEFNGTFWHRDKRFYNKNAIKDKFKIDDVCKRVWKSDSKKLKIAKINGYNIKIIWQYDWEKCENKLEYINKLL